MKKLILIIIISMLLAGMFANANPLKSKDPVHVISTEDNAIYFKVSKALIGAAIEIYNENGTKLISHQITDRRVLIDFYFGKPGKYYIKLTKSTGDEHFVFTKFDPAAYSRLPENELISVTQGLDIF